MLDLLELPRWTYELLFVFYAVTASGFVLLERRRPGTTLAWILALVFLPIIGLTAYIVIGRRPYRRSRRRRVRFSKQRPARSTAIREDHLPGELSLSQRGIVRHAIRATGVPLRRSANVQLLQAGDEAFHAVERAIQNARHFIHLEFYIWRADESGTRLRELLIERARAGIEIRLLYDYVGSFGTPDRHFDPLLAAGGQVAAYSPLLLPAFLTSRASFRNHRKLISVDGELGFLGGINVGNEYLGPGSSEVRNWEDLFVRIEGEAALGLEEVFQEDWFEATGNLIDVVPALSTTAREASATGPLLQIIPSRPDERIASVIATQFTAAISSAQRRCWIATPYFIPVEALRLILASSAMRGVDVRILVPRWSDSRLVSLASQSYYDELLAAGCRIFEYPLMLHSKYLIVDDDLAAIGSANMDIRSFYLNFELTAMFYDRGVTTELASFFLRGIERSREVRSTELRRRSLAWKFAESAARVLSPLL